MFTHRAITIGEVMTPYPYSVEASEKIEVANKMMAEHEIRHLPVVRESKPVSILTSRDVQLVLKNVLSRGGSTEGMIVAQICPLQAFMISTDELLIRVVREMHTKHIGSAIVTEEGRLAGIFTVTDACRVLGDLLVQLPAPGTPPDPEEE
jgi:CBS domain-containing protein